MIADGGPQQGAAPLVITDPFHWQVLGVQQRVIFSLPVVLVDGLLEAWGHMAVGDREAAMARFDEVASQNGGMIWQGF